MSDDLCAEIEALASEYDANGNGTVDAAGVAFDLRALLAAHPVQDEATFETTLLDPVWLTTSSGRCTTHPVPSPVQVTTADPLGPTLIIGRLEVVDRAVSQALCYLKIGPPPKRVDEHTLVVETITEAVLDALDTAVRDEESIGARCARMCPDINGEHCCSPEVTP